MYKSETKRLETFQNWNVSFTSPSKEELANSGFISTKQGDKVRCVFGSCIVDKWEDGDDPYDHHLKDPPCCNFLSVLDNHTGISYNQL